jgi:hypothetical protein
MILAINQPYVFPYIGYFQLLNAVNTFVVYEDVTFIKQGFINRNRILVNNTAFLFSVPIHNISSYELIQHTKIDIRNYEIWKTKFTKTLLQSYSKAPYFTHCFDLVQGVINSSPSTISTLAIDSIKAVQNYLQIPTLIKTSVGYDNQNLHSKDRVLDICYREQATVYINADGGRELYSRTLFKEKGVELRFIKSRNTAYKQFGKPFVPWLSIIDIMMFNSPAEIKNMLLDCEIK